MKFRALFGSDVLPHLCTTAFLLLVFHHFAAMSFAQDRSQNDESPPIRQGKLESLTSKVNGELVKGKTIDLEGELVIIFKTGLETYATLKPDFENVLAEIPAIDVPPGLTAEILDIRVTQCDVDVIIGIGKGYSIHCTVHVSTEENVTPGDHDVIIALPAASDIAKAIEATSPTEPPTYTFHLKVYESEEAQANANAAAEKVREEHVAAERRRKQADEEEQAKKRQQLWFIACGIAAVLFVLYLIVKLVGPWIAPTYRVGLRRHTSTAITGSLMRSTAIDRSGVGAATPDFVHATYSATSFWGSRADIKVDVVSESAQVTDFETKTYTDGEHTGSSFSRETKYQVKIVVTANSGASPGHYVARTEAGSLLLSIS